MITRRRPEEFTLHERNGVMLGEWPTLATALGVDLALTTRSGGVSEGPYESLNLALHVGDDPEAVRENRRRAALAFGCAAGDMVFAGQVHGATAAEVRSDDRGRGLESERDAVLGVDALVTTDPSAVLVVMVADCVPMVLIDRVGHRMAGVHAGWRGTLGGVAESALDTLERLGADRGHVVAVLGPSVDAVRYQIGPDVASAVRTRLGARAEPLLRPDGDGHWRFDLEGALVAVLVEAGVRAERIVAAPMATGAGTPFYSDRAARPCGRFALLARLRPYDENAPTAL